MTSIPNARTAKLSHVFRPRDLPAKSRGGGAKTIPFATAARGATTFLNGTTIFEPGSQIAHHTHNVAESVMVIAGEAIVDIDGERFPLKTFDTTFVPANVPHHFENASGSEEMRILWTYGSLDATRTITETQVTGRVDSEAAAGPHSLPPIVEVATFNVKIGHENAFELALAAAVPLFQAAEGARTFALDVSEECPQRYTLRVGWDSVRAHTEVFRNSAAFAEWRALFLDHVEELPQVEHQRSVLVGF